MKGYERGVRREEGRRDSGHLEVNPLLLPIQYQFDLPHDPQFVITYQIHYLYMDRSCTGAPGILVATYIVTVQC